MSPSVINMQEHSLDIRQQTKPLLLDRMEIYVNVCMQLGEKEIKKEREGESKSENMDHLICMHCN